MVTRPRWTTRVPHFTRTTRPGYRQLQEQWMSVSSPSQFFPALVLISCLFFGFVESLTFTLYAFYFPSPPAACNIVSTHLNFIFMFLYVLDYQYFCGGTCKSAELAICMFLSYFQSVHYFNQSFAMT